VSLAIGPFKLLIAISFLDLNELHAVTEKSNRTRKLLYFISVIWFVDLI
jgi:hypothetical protein